MLELKRKDANGSSMKFSNSSKKLGVAGFTSGGNFVVDGTDDADGSGNMLKIDQSGNQTVTGSETVNKDLTVKGNANLPFINTSSRGAQTVKNYYTVDLSALSTTNWYPVTFYSSDLELDCEIHGHNTSGSAAFNQNIIHFLLTSQGWSDTPVRLTVLNWGAYSTTELTIMMIVKGNHSGMNAVYLRGGQKYRFICNRTPTLRTSGITNGDESFPVVTTYTSGTNTTIMWRADLMASSGVYNQLQATRFSGKVKAAAGLDVTGDAAIDGALEVGGAINAGGAISSNGIINGMTCRSRNDNIEIGNDALSSNTEGLYNIAVGASALKSNTKGSFNVAVGANTDCIKPTYNNQVNINNRLLFIEFAASATQATVYSTLIWYFPFNKDGAGDFWVTCLGRYRYEIDALCNNNDGNIDFFDKSSKISLTIYKGSSSTLGYPLRLWFPDVMEPVSSTNK